MQAESLCQELASGAELIRQLLTGISTDDGRFKASADSWSMLEVACHLYDEEREDFRQRLDIILHRPNDGWPPIDTVGWVTARGYNERDLADMLERFLSERRQSLEWLRGLTSPNWEAEYATPFRVMKAGDMLSSWVAHDHLHTRQLVELRRHRVLRLTQPYDVRYAGEW
jgi:DinB superfamily